MPGRILVADGDRPAAELVVRALTAAQWQTTVVAAGDAALAHGLSGRYTLLLLDTGLPRRDGLTVLRQLRAAGVCVPVILMSAGATPSDIATGLDAGADDYVTKPARLDELLARIRLRSRRAREAADGGDVPHGLVPTARWALDDSYGPVWAHGRSPRRS